MSSTYHSHNVGLSVVVSIASSSKDSMYMLATIGESGDPLGALSFVGRTFLHTGSMSSSGRTQLASVCCPH